MAESTPPSTDAGMPAVDPMGNPLGSGAQAAQEPSFDGNKVIGRLKTAGEPDHEPPAEEKGGLRRWWENTKHEVGEALEHPVEGLKGAVKGTLNLVPQTAELVSKGAMHIVADDAEAVASALKWAGKEDWANATADFAKGTKTSAQNLDLPKFQMSNDAQRGGDTIATALSLATGVGGLVKSGAKAAAKGAARATAREAGGVERAIGEAEAASTAESQAAKTTSSQPPGQGTVIDSKKSKRQQVQRNKKDGSRREKETEEELIQQNPEASVQREQYLRDKDGNIAKDPITGEARRIDHVVIQDGKVVDAVETTSMTADKTLQTAKEKSILENGGTFIRDRTNGNLVPMNENGIRIIRRE